MSERWKVKKHTHTHTCSNQRCSEVRSCSFWDTERTFALQHCKKQKSILHTVHNIYCLPRSWGHRSHTPTRSVRTPSATCAEKQSTYPLIHPSPSGFWRDRANFSKAWQANHDAISFRGWNNIFTKIYIHIHKKSESSRISRAESIVYCSSLLAFASEKSKSQDHSIMIKKVLSPSLSLSPSACSTHDSASTYCRLCYSSSAASIYDLIRKRASSSRNEKCFHIWIFESVQYWVAQLFHTTQKHSRGSRWFTGNSKTLWTV